ncbi:peptidase M54 [Thermococcus sp. GR7]|nr:MULTISPECIES: peptidase M54 [unclassified Thermococcus]NJE47636.1 peptidase M54 [Thermococcus sp. GR7]NJE78950.1 peptidase M54 [Thermococcus sp. GR4]NJF22600.1 peptidase M54 [Thermococcus sp. GR5]
MEFIAFTYVGNFVDKEIITDVLFNVFDDANRFFHQNEIPVRFLYIGKLELEPGYLINLNTPEGRIRVYPLEALVEVLYSRLLQEINEKEDIKMNKIFALTTFPLVSRNPYFDFYEKFLGIHEVITGLRIMILSMKPFEVPITPDDSPHERRRKLETFKSRLLKGILHEVGHSFGLEHCNNQCVMHPPTNIEDWDGRIPGYCDECLLKLRAALER